MRKLIWMTAICAGVVYLTILLTDRFVDGRVYAQAAQVRSEPFVARFKVTGDSTTAQELILAVRADGSRSELKSFWSPTAKVVAVQRTVVDLQSRRRVFVDGLTQSLVTYELSNRNVDDVILDSVNCRPPASSEVSTLLGYRVHKVEEQLTDPGRTSREKWIAPDLGCLIAKEVHTSTIQGDRKIVGGREVIEISKGEPNASYFEIPSNFVERSPSGVQAEYNRRYQPDAPTKPMETQDRVYAAKKPK